MISSARSALRTASLLAVVAIVAAAGPACFGATEIRVAVTTTAPCASGLETEIYSGTRGDDFFGGAPAAQTNACGPVEPRIGSLVVVPSSARDTRFDLEVITGVGVPVSTCRANDFKSCIVARRRVTFRPHKSLEVPILLSDRCIGVPCGADETCDLGVCAPTVECTEETGCPRERGEVPEVVGPDLDAAVDAPVDGQPPVDVDGGTRCGTTPTVVALGQAIVGPLAIDGADFVYANVPSAAPAAIHRVPRSGGTVAIVQAAPSLLAVTAGSQGVAWATASAGGMTLTRRAPALQVAVAVPDYTTQSLAFAGTSVVGVAVPRPGSAGGLVSKSFAFGSALAFEENASGVPSSWVSPSPEIAVDEDGHFFAVSGGNVVHYTVEADKPVLSGALQSAVPSPDIAAADRTLFVALNNARPGIHRIPRAQVVALYAGTPLVPGVLPRSLATDGLNLYYLVGTELFRVSALASGANPPVSLGTVPASADRLVVDAECIYWIEEGARIVRRAK